MTIKPPDTPEQSSPTRTRTTVRPILMTGALVRETIALRKHETRRIIRDQPNDEFRPGTTKEFRYYPQRHAFTPLAHCPDERCVARTGIDVKPVYGMPGDFLYVRETWALTGAGVQYAADAKHEQPYWDSLKWRPSIHMQKAHARLLLLLADVRIERLQSITDAAAVREGIHTVDGNGEWNGLVFPSPREAFFELWDTINGTRGPATDRACFRSARNPWVWVLSYSLYDIKTGVALERLP